MSESRIDNAANTGFQARDELVNAPSAQSTCLKSASAVAWYDGPSAWDWTSVWD